VSAATYEPTSGPAEGRGKARSLLRAGPVAVALLGFGLLAAACGGGSAPGVASIGSTTPTTTVSSPGGSLGPAGGAGGAGSGASGATVGMGGLTVAYSECMRARGISDFPDPNSEGEVTFQASGGLSPSSPRFQAAQKVCSGLLPMGSSGRGQSPAQQAERLAELLKFSECMRAHGISDFPDPNSQEGGISLSLRGKGSGSDLNPNSPRFQAAQKACGSLMAGHFAKETIVGARSTS